MGGVVSEIRSIISTQRSRLVLGALTALGAIVWLSGAGWLLISGCTIALIIAAAARIARAQLAEERADGAAEVSRANARLRIVTLLSLAMFSMLMASIIPPLQSPDEDAHLYRAYSLLENDFFVRENSRLSPGNQEVDAGLEQFVLHWTSRLAARPANRVDAATERLGRDFRFAGREQDVFNPAAAYMPVLYAPAALALGVARATNQPIWVANAWARIAMLGISLVAIGLALVIARAGVKTFCAVALLPMSLAQFGSVNLDSMTIGFGMLLVAFMTAGVFGGPAGVRPSFWVQCSVWLLLGLLIATKPIFAAMLLPIAAWSIRKGQRKRLWTAALVLVPLLLWTAHVSASFVDVRVLIDGSALMRMTGLVMDPLLLIEMLVNSFRLKSEFYGASMIGVLGWLDTWLPSGIYLYATLLLAAALVGDALSRNAIRPVDRGLLAAAFPAFVLTTMVILWAAWTPVGAEAIEGVQGRYFLPVLPLLACVLGARHSTDREVAATTAFTLAIVLYSAGLAWDLPRVLIYRYWL